jgi:glutamate/tyrosine decarboxylase-like PLP-dependent enzyme
MAKLTLRDRLDEMTGRFFIVNGNSEKVESWQLLDEDTVSIKTDQDEYQFPFDLADERLKRDFLPVEDGLDTVSKNIPLRACNTETLASLRDIMLENIKKIQADKEYLPQAQEVSKSVGVIVDLAKTEIEYFKAIKNL